MKWAINFSIPNCNYNLVDYTIATFVKSIPKKNGEQLFKEWYLAFQEGTVTSYIPVSILEEMVEWIKEKIIADPDWADQLHQKTEQTNREYFACAEDILKMDLRNLSDGEIYNVYCKLRKYQLDSHTFAISTTWFVDSRGEVFSKYLRERLETHLAGRGVVDPVKVIKYFVLFTTPIRGDGFIPEEQMDFLMLLQNIQKDLQAVKVFSEEAVENIFKLLPPFWQDKIKAHHSKWCWTPYTYVGPIYDLNYYIEEIKKQIKTDNIQKIIEEETNRPKKMSDALKELTTSLQLPDDLAHLFSIARDIIWLKDFRKYCSYHGHYVLDTINREVANRLHLSLKQVNFLIKDDYYQALVDRVYDEQILNERIKYSVFWSDGEKIKYYYGEEAKKLIDNLDIEEIKIDEKAGFRGTCAFPGIVQGSVKIVKGTEDLAKVYAGDIMLSISTYPAFLPAMKKAAAIVTEDGGITCHAAIVAREFKIPCVVGAKKITKILQDGEMVEVDATKGIIKKL